MTKEEIIFSLKKIVKPYVQNESAYDNFDEQTNFISDLEINSANLVDIVLDVEDEFNIAIDNESMQEMITVKQAVQIVETKLQNT